MDSEGIYNLFPEDFDEQKRKNKNAKKSKKLENALNNLFRENNNKKKKSKNKSKKKYKKFRKIEAVKFKYRMIEKATDKSLRTASNVIEMFAESKFFPNGRGNKK